MKFLSFTSGSCGNCYYLGEGPGKAGLLIDAGVSMRRAKQVLAQHNIALADICGILVTHDHLDHIRFLGTYCKCLKPRVYTTYKLHGALAAHSFTRDHIAPCRAILQKEEWNEIGGGFKVRYFEVPHDATQTVGYAVEKEGELFVLMTDLEHVTDEAMELARGAHTVVIESNYDREMLLGGPYPPELKQRILKEGHLSNSACANAVCSLYHEGIRNIFLCHLSGNNNTPALAYDTTAAALREIGVDPASVHLRTLQRDTPGPLLTL